MFWFDIYCSMITTVALTNTSLVSRNYPFCGGSTAFWRYSTLEKFFVSEWSYFIFFLEFYLLLKGKRKDEEENFTFIPVFQQ